MVMEVPLISAIILYYLNMKPTHGYEIQKFLQVSGMEQWTKIQSGSIYYALTKLEKEKYIRVLREERTGSRVRKIYEITDSGKEELHREMAQELDQLISPIGSTKFFTDPMLSTLNKEEIYQIVSNHIGKLEEQKVYWEKWYHIKADETATKLTKIAFQMTIENIKYQIIWHQELLDHIDEYITSSKEIEEMIRTLDFGQMEVDDTVSDDEQKLKYTVKLKDELLKDPKNALVNLDKIIEKLESQVKKK